MAQNRSLLQTMTTMLESQGRQIRILVTKVNDLQEQVRTIQPQTYLHPIPKPRQGKEFSRSTSVAGWLFEAITALNQEISEGDRKYLQFPSDIDFRRLNSDCIREFEGLMSFHIPDLCGKVTWEEAYNRRPKDCEKVIREARTLPELAVFSQAAGQWALRQLCANKMRTLMATNMKRSGKRKTRDGTNERLIVEADEYEFQDGMDKMQTETCMPEMTLQEVTDVEVEQDQEGVNYCDVGDEASISEIEDGQFESKELPDESEFANHAMDDAGCNNVSQIEEVETIGNQLEDEHDTAFAISEDIGKISSGSDIPKDCSPAKLQVAAQRAARKLLTADEETPYRHSRVFNDSSHPDLSEAQDEIFGNSRLSTGNRKDYIPGAKTSGTKVKAVQNRQSTLGIRKLGNRKDIRVQSSLNGTGRRETLTRKQHPKNRIQRQTSQKVGKMMSNRMVAPLKANAVDNIPGIGGSIASRNPKGANQKNPSMIRKTNTCRSIDPTIRSSETLKAHKHSRDRQESLKLIQSDAAESFDYWPSRKQEKSPCRKQSQSEGKARKFNSAELKNAN